MFIVKFCIKSYFMYLLVLHFIVDLFIIEIQHHLCWISWYKSRWVTQLLVALWRSGVCISLWLDGWEFTFLHNAFSHRQIILPMCLDPCINRIFIWGWGWCRCARIGVRVCVDGKVGVCVRELMACEFLYIIYFTTLSLIPTNIRATITDLDLGFLTTCRKMQLITSSKS